MLDCSFARSDSLVSEYAYFVPFAIAEQFCKQLSLLRVRIASVQTQHFVFGIFKDKIHGINE